MTPPVDPSDDLLARFIDGELSRAQARELETMIGAEPHLQRRVADLRVLLNVPPPHVTPDAGGLWSAIRRRALEEKSPNIPARTAAPARPRRPKLATGRFNFAAAAAAFLVIASGATWFAWTRRPHDAAAPVASAEPRHYSTSRGQNATIQLTDGSQVVLAPASRLTIPADYGAPNRAIGLDGEAIFSVRHDATHPFRVRARGAVVEDLGTRFDVRAYQNDAAVTVAVAEGAVTLGRERSTPAGAGHPAAEGVVLHQGEVGSLDRAGAVSSVRTSRIASRLAWSRGRLVFVARPLPEVLVEIGRWYALDIRVPDERLASRLVTAEFSTQSVSEMIDALALAVDANVTRSGQVVTLRAR
ncbi:MAG: FecR domain-containing protein [Gemmatimonadales bacterium]